MPGSGLAAGYLGGVCASAIFDADSTLVSSQSQQLSLMVRTGYESLQV